MPSPSPDTVALRSPDEPSDAVAARITQLEADNARLTAELKAREEELSALANVFVAGQQLSGTLDVAGVLTHLRELLQQLIGAKRFVILMADKSAGALALLAHDGVDPTRYDPVSLDGDARPDTAAILRVFAGGVAEISKVDLVRAAGDKPLAVVPLTLAGRVEGVLAVIDVFEQKQTFTEVDRALFAFLSRRALSALTGALLFTASGQTFPRPGELLAAESAAIARRRTSETV